MEEETGGEKQEGESNKGSPFKEDEEEVGTPYKETSEERRGSMSEEKYTRRVSEIVHLEQLSREASRLSLEKEQVRAKLHSVANENELLQKKLSKCLE